MKTTSYFRYVLMIGTFASCNQIRFNQPLPLTAHTVSVIPIELRGSFVGSDLKHDTLTFDSLVLRLSSDKTPYVIGEKLIIKKVDEIYFINVHTDHWELGIATQLTSNTWQLETFAFNPEEPDPFINKVKKIMKLTSLKSGDYLANPTDKQLEKVLVSKALPASLFEKIN